MVDEFRPNRVLATDRPYPPWRVSEVRGSLWWRSSSPEILVLGSVSGDGVRPVHLSGEPARYRSVPGFDARQAIPHGLSWQGGPMPALQVPYLQRSVTRCGNRTPPVFRHSHRSDPGRVPFECPHFMPALQVHTFNVLSSEAEIARRPSPVTSTPVTAEECAGSVRNNPVPGESSIASSGLNHGRGAPASMHCRNSPNLVFCACGSKRATNYEANCLESLSITCQPRRTAS